MTFLHATLALAGLACVAIPIIIHLLFRRRRKPIVFGAMRFLVEALQRQRRRLRLEQLLLLLARCLALACLAAALGRPALEAAGLLGAGAGRTLYLLIDTSLASGAERTAAAPRAPGDGAPTPSGAARPTSLDRAKTHAIALLDALGPSDRAALIALGAPADARVLPPSSDLSSIRSMIEGLTPTDAGADWPGAFRALAQDINRPASGGGASGGAPVVAALSDFTLGAADLSSPLPRLDTRPGAAPIRLLASRPIADAAGNVQVMGVEPLRSLVLTGLGDGSGGAGEAQVVRVPLRRTGPIVAEAGVTSVRIRVTPASSAAPVARATVRWSPGQSEAVASAQLDPSALAGSGERALVAEIDQDALPSDNTARRPIPVREALRVGLIDRRRFGAGMRADRMTAGEWLRLALRPSAGVGATVESVDLEPAAIDAASLAGLDAVCVARPDLLEEDAWMRLRRFADAGGLVIVAPPSEANVHVWTDAFIRAMGLGWTIAREPRADPEGSRFADEQPASPLLALLRDELPDLLKPVNVFRSLPIEAAPAQARAILALHDGAPWLLAAAPGSGDARDASASTSDGAANRAAGAAPGSATSGASGAAATTGAGTESVGAGLVLYFASPLELVWTDLPAKPLMVPLMHELVRQGAGQAAQAWTQLAGSRVRAPARASALIDLARPTGERAALAISEDGRTAEPVRLAALLRATDERGVDRGLIAVNPDTAAGRTDAQAPQAVGAWLGRAMGAETGGTDAEAAEPVTWLDEADPGVAFRARQADASLSFPLLLAALAFLLLETSLARVFSHATVASASDAGSPRGAGFAGVLDDVSEAA